MPLTETGLSQNTFYLVSLTGGLVMMIVFGLAGGWVRRQRRSREVLAQARQLGFTLMPRFDRTFTDRIRCAYPPSANARAFNAAYRRHNELMIYLFDVRITQNENNRSQSGAEQGVVALVSPLLTLPPFLLISRPAALEKIGLVANLVDLALKQVGLAYGYRQVSFAIDSEFDRCYALFTNNEEAVKSFFTAFLVSRLCQTGGYMAHGGGDTLLLGSFNLARAKNAVSTNQISERITQARQLYGWILDKR